MSMILLIDGPKFTRSRIRELIEAKVHGARVVETSPFELLSKSQYFDLVLVTPGLWAATCLLC